MSRANGPDGIPASCDKARFVEDGFNRIATAYDRVNDWMTFGLHRRWKRFLLDWVDLREAQTVLDLCTGTGDLAHLAAGRVGTQGRVTGLDFAAGMLEIASHRTDWPCSDKPGLQPQWIRADALHLPFPDDSFHVVTTGYGLRNVTDLPLALSEIRRVLIPGGRFISLDTCEPSNPLLRLGYRFHAFTVVPFLGRWMSGSAAMYRYLPASAARFETPEQLEERLHDVGFAQTETRRKLLGAAALVMGQLA